jgi:hypothetical protein
MESSGKLDRPNCKSSRDVSIGTMRRQPQGSFIRKNAPDEFQYGQPSRKLSKIFCAPHCRTSARSTECCATLRTFSTAMVACIASCMTPSKRGISICRLGTISRLCAPSAEREDQLSSSVPWFSPSRSGTRILGGRQRGGAHAHFNSMRERDQQHHRGLGERCCSLGETVEKWKHRRHLTDERRHQAKLQRH